MTSIHSDRLPITCAKRFRKVARIILELHRLREQVCLAQELICVRFTIRFPIVS